MVDTIIVATLISIAYIAIRCLVKKLVKKFT